MFGPSLIQVSKDRYRLASDFSYSWSNHGLVNRILVREGFEFDGATIPYVVSGLMGGRWGLGYVPPLIHDLLYRCNGCVRCAHKGSLHEVLLVTASASKRIDHKWVVVPGRWTREEADKMFGRHMREFNVPKLRRRLAYYGVRLGGSYYWNSSCCTCRHKVKR
jgi:hypothetical protein